MRKWRKCASLHSVQCSPIFGFFQLGKVQNFPASFSSSELSAHQMGVRRVFGGPPFYLAGAKDQSVSSSNGRSSCRTRTFIKLHFPVAPTLWKELPQGPQGTTALSTPPFVRAGYDCRNNTTSLRRPEAVGWAPSVLAGPLTTSLRGLWVSVLLPPGNGSGDPKTDQVTQGADS